MIDSSLEDAIAIIGVAARFPGGFDADSLWSVLERGDTTATRFAKTELDPSLPATLVDSSSYVPVRGIMPGAEEFDASYFGFSPREAEILDPQQRVFLQLAVHALENAGYYKDTRSIPIGVYAGQSNITYFKSHIENRPDVLARVGELNAMMGNEKDYLTTRVAHKLDLTGPCINISTACSTSAVAIAQAFQALQNFQCDLALAGGVSVTTPQNRGYLYQEGSILAPDGVCRPFDARAQGTFFSNGGGIIVLKRLQEAIDDGDNIAAILRGVALNNDGARRASFAAPGVEGQADAISQALANADVDASHVGYVEAHGTATPIGDPIEVQALKLAFEQHTDARGFCALGSLKSNLGHLDVAAGVAGVIKIILSMQHKKIPATANFQSANPELDIDNTPFYVNGETIDWPEIGGTRIAGISSFGSGGTNAHLILQQASEYERETVDKEQAHVIYLSAKSQAAVGRQIAELETYTSANPSMCIADIAHTLRVGRQEESCRTSFVANSTASLSEQLLQIGARAGKVANKNSSGIRKQIAFVFPGQGAQYPGMGLDLYENFTNDTIRATLDECFALFDQHLDTPLKHILFDSSDSDDPKINQTQYTQPAMFSIGLALARAYAVAEFKPSAMIGHSIGEYLAAHLAGVFSLEDAVAIVARRATLMQQMEPGAMVSIFAPPDQIAPYVEEFGIQIAAYNTPGSTVVAGTFEAMDAIEARLEKDGLSATRLRTSHAFHSHMMDSAAADLVEFVKTRQLNPPDIPFVSTVTGVWITDAEATSPEYWGSQIRNPVKFSQAATFLLEQGPATFVELGPRATTTGFVRQHIEDKAQHDACAGLDTLKSSISESESLLAGLGKLWEQGHNPTITNLLAAEQPRRIPLPGYPFEPKRHWIEATTSGAVAPVAIAPDTTYSPAVDGEVNTAAVPEGPPLQASLRALIADTIGIGTDEIEDDSEFIELGFDSLMLTQFSLALRSTYDINLPFRKLQEEFGAFETLLAHLEKHISPEVLSQLTPAPTVAPAPNLSSQAALPGSDNGGFVDYLREQAALIDRYLARQDAPVHQKKNEAPAIPGPASPAATVPAASAPTLNPGRGAKITTKRHAKPDDDQVRAINSIISDYNEKTANSKRLTQESRAVLSDPRSVSGFNPLWKEAVYPIITDRSDGAYLWDIDGNQYIDFTCGFGPILIGHNPDFLKAALTTQINAGVETGPQTLLAKEVADLIVQATGVERVAFASTGTEAVTAATRIARTVTGRDKIVIFKGAYHGIHDEVTLNPRHLGDATPGAPGIPKSNLANMLVVEYGSAEALATIKARKDEIAAVLVEPVQSRDPAHQPREFIKELRQLTTDLDIALIFDEIVTGFRLALGGAQAYYGIQADIVTYGKVVGGGYPVGIVAGSHKYLDALDGGTWQFGDDSMPEIGVTFFAGTFVRHPLMLAACKATLQYLVDQGPELQESLNSRTETLCNTLQQVAANSGVGINIARCSSWFTLEFEDPTYAPLFYVLMRSQGIFLWEDKAVFIASAQSDEDHARFTAAFEASLRRMALEKLLPTTRDGHESAQMTTELDASRPPVPGARLGKDPRGRPGWYVPDPENSGSYRLLNIPTLQEESS